MKIEAQLEDNIVVITPQGEWIDIYDRKTRLHEVVKEHIDKGYRKYILYLDQVDILDSSGIGDIIASYVSLNEAGGKLNAVLTQKRIRLVFKVIKADEVFGFFDSIDEAKADLLP